MSFKDPLVHAIASGNVAEVAKLLRVQEFTIIEAVDESGSDDKAAVMAEVDDCPVLVAFTSQDHASRFAAEMPELLGTDGTMSGFVVDGTDLLAHLPEEHGVLLNPETEDSAVLTPEFIEEIRRVEATSG